MDKSNLMKTAQAETQELPPPPYTEGSEMPQLDQKAMDSLEPPQKLQDGSEAYALYFDFQWRKWQCSVTESPKSANPVYIVDVNSFKSPHLTFKRQPDGATIATGTLHVVDISADCVLNGKPMLIKALKRLETKYEHLSQNLTNDKGLPMRMTWTSSSGWKKWDFICLDEDKVAVAKFSLNIWATKKFGKIEFMGNRNAVSDAFRDEITVVGLTLCQQMILRINNVLNLAGSVFSKTGHIKAGDKDAQADVKGDYELEEHKKDL